MSNISDFLKRQLEILSNHKSLHLDQYKVNVELSVITDKTAITGKTSEKFAISLNNDQDIRDSENQDSRTETQTIVNNEQEENEGEYIAADESMTICVKDILEGSIEVSSVINEVTKIFLNKFSKTFIIDL
ncbi:7925_t:CDS:2 [Funneliformis caledonium]|uniref:7925_t:CDS:1 n=1 Tax=Funneliformis caledonium TaxID=1117310 RepID=A0A9N8VLT5_9GLOM|nr:7925_t:CDS:2 [Funneliformis caledonium]